MIRRSSLRGILAGTIGLLLLCLLTSLASGELVPLPHQPAGVAFPESNWPTADLPDALNLSVFDATIARNFAKRGRGGLGDTRALLLIHRGAIVFERYADGFDAETRFHSWSMAKSITNAVVGILVGMKRLDIDEPANVPAWRKSGDPRAAITLRDLLQLSAGTDNADVMGTRTDTLVSRMLYGDKAGYMAQFAADVPLIHPPGSHWAYSTGTSNIIADIAGREVGGGREEMLAFMRQALFDRIGMKSAVPEFDGTGHFVGGAHFYANARDYARFGLLYLRDGRWGGERILPEGWVDFSRTRGPAENNGNYAAQFWLSMPAAEGQFLSLPDAPPGTFSANGNEGQFIAMVPSHDLVVVRLGVIHAMTFPELMADISDLIDAFPALTPVAAQEQR